MRINRNQTLWRTRGKEWDYAFTSTPDSIPDLDGQWYQVHKKVFFDPKIEHSMPYYQGGSLKLSRHEQKFYRAVACKDPFRQDIQGRTIVHYIVVFFDESPAEKEEWGQELLSALADEIDRTVNAKDSELLRFDPVDVTGSSNTDRYRETDMDLSNLSKKKSWTTASILALALIGMAFVYSLARD